MKVTVREIARQAGVSPASVSLVLNGKPSRITEETKKRIWDTANKLGYEVKEKKTEKVLPKEMLLGVIHPGFGNMLADDCINGIENFAFVHGYRVLVCNAADSSERAAMYLKTLSACKVDGLIMIPPLDMNKNGNDAMLGKALRQIKIPFILLDRAINQVFCDFITADNKQGAYMAVEHLIQKGHTRIGMIAGINGVYNNRKRLEGYKEALSFHKLPIEEELIYYGDYRLDSGYAAADYFWKLGISALFASSDEMAMGVYQFARERGLIIGEDISLVGFDDVPVSRRLDPPLTTIRQQGELMGKKACEMAIKRITKEEDKEIRNTYFAPQLMERESVKDINKSVR